MNSNYTYIIASIPALTPQYRPDGGSTKALVDWIKSQLGAKDAAKVDFVCSGFASENLTEDFYAKAFAAKDAFTGRFFAADMALRNAKVNYLNTELERPAGKDVMEIAGAPQVEGRERIDAIFTGSNLLERERAIDDFLWNTASEITLMMNFRLENILAIVAKLCIIQRWLALDEEAGRELLAKLVGDIRGSYGEIKFETIR